MDNRLYVEEIINVWLLKFVEKEKHLYLAGKISEWNTLRNKYNSKNRFNINNFIFSTDSKPRITGLSAVLFSIIAAVIIKNGEVDIFYDIFSYKGLKLFFVISILVIELFFIACMIVYLIKEVVDYVNDILNDKLQMDRNPSSLRVDRFVKRLLLNTTINIEK